MSGFKLYLFDLDGTLVDTAPDILDAVARVAAEEGLVCEDLASLRAYVSHGAAAVLKRALPPADPNTETARYERLLEIYGNRLSVRSRLFDGLDGFLTELEGRGLRWGVVTNKPGALTRPLMQELALSGRSAALVSGDDLAVKKPDPAPLFEAARQANIDIGETVYIGDAERDMQAARAARCVAVAALWGYIAPDENPAAWDCDHRVDRPPGLRMLLDRAV